MPTYYQLLGRADQNLLLKHLDPASVRLLNALNASGESTSTTRQIFSSIYSPSDVLTRSNIRTDLISLLRISEATELAAELGLKGDPFFALSKVNVIFGSVAFQKIANFLNIEIEEELAQVEPPPEKELAPNYGLFKHQSEAVSKVKKELSSSGGRVVLHMPTGAGKTRSAMHVICDHLIEDGNNSVLWLASSEELCEQAAIEFERAWITRGNRSSYLYRIWGNRNLDTQTIRPGLIVAGFAKLYSMARQRAPILAELGDRITLIVVDEAHQAIAETYQLVIDGISARNANMQVLGLTATPGRTWNDRDKDLQLANFFKQRKVTLEVEGYSDPVSYLVDKGYLAKPNFRSLTHFGSELNDSEKHKLTISFEIPSEVLEKLANDEIRTLSIVREIESLARTHKRILVFATTVAHAEIINVILTSRGLNTRSVTGRSSSVDRTSVISWYKDLNDDNRILINFGVLTTGFDAPKTSAVLIARPTKSLVLYSQMVGRAIRGILAGGNLTADIITVVDVNLPGFGDLSEAFKNWEDVW